MRLQNGTFWLELAPPLIEEAVSAASRVAPEALRRQYLEERDAVATIEIVDIREQSFRDLDGFWMERFGVLESLRSIFAEGGPLSNGVAGCVLDRARPPVEEQARWDTLADGSKVLTLYLRGETVASPDRLRSFLENVE